MSETTADEYFPHDTYHSQWFLFWVIAVISGIALWLNFFRPVPMTVSPRAAISAGYDWFLVLHMPEVPKEAAKAEALRRRYDEWLTALGRQGYEPMLLSEVHKRLTSGAGLPEKTIVFVFDPAYNHTYETLSPLFVQYRFPALWVTDHTALLRGDRHYIHQHQAKWMVRSGFWDLGYKGDGFWRKASEANNVLINESEDTTWQAGQGKTALNWTTQWPHLRQLDVSPKWTADELITRLEMELPLEGTVWLGVKRLEHRLWGVVSPSAKKNAPFILQSDLSSTSAALYWLGTRGARDMTLDIDIPSYFGEVSLLARSEYKTQQGILIGFSRRGIFIDQKINNSRKRLASTSWVSSSGAIKGRVTLIGNEIRATIQGAAPLNAALAPAPALTGGMVRLQVFDRVRGAARADFVRLKLTALDKPVASK